LEGGRKQQEVLYPLFQGHIRLLTSPLALLTDMNVDNGPIKWFLSGVVLAAFGEYLPFTQRFYFLGRDLVYTGASLTVHFNLN
jgi:hypothetical protein